MNDELLNTNIKTKDGKILHHIRTNSYVLEFGPGYGRMTKFMKERLGCKVFIIEIDTEAYNNAMQYAAGGICRDILDFSWENEFKDIAFDHIIFANVLEHLLDPWEVLSRSLSFLKDDGSVLLSVPNAAHNAVIINLINNKFEYKNTGILDKSNVRFFSYFSMMEMFNNCSLVPVIEDGTICSPENTEFKVTSNDLNVNSEIIENREYANIYQFVFKCIKKKYYIEHKDTFVIQKLYEQKLNGKKPVSSCFIFLDTGSGFTSDNFLKAPLYIKGNEFETIFELQPDVSRIRFDPYEGYACLLDNLKIITNHGTINYSDTNAVAFNGILIFDTIDPQVIINLNNLLVSHIKITGNIYRYNFNDIIFLSKLKQLVIEQNELIHSKFWRITKPLRLLAGIFKKTKD